MKSLVLIALIALSTSSTFARTTGVDLKCQSEVSENLYQLSVTIESSLNSNLVIYTIVQESLNGTFGPIAGFVTEQYSHHGYRVYVGEGFELYVEEEESDIVSIPPSYKGLLVSAEVKDGQPVAVRCTQEN